MATGSVVEYPRCHYFRRDSWLRLFIFEVKMGFEQLIIAAQSWGPTAVTTIVAFAFAYVLKQQDKNSKADKERDVQFKKVLSSGLERIELHFEQDITELKEQLEKHSEDIELLKADKLNKNDFFKDMGGWRKEINRLQDLIIKQNDSTIQKIIELWKKQQ